MSVFAEVPGLNLAPAEVVARCCHEPEMVFFDTALVRPGGEAVSLIAAQPSFILSGRTREDWDGLRRTLAAHRAVDVAARLVPPGFAAGWIDYNGAFRFAFFDRLLAYLHAENRWVSAGGAENAGWMRQATPRSITGRLEFQPSMARDDFVRRVQRAQAYIAAGDIYQVNLSHRWSAPWPNGDPFGFYTALRQCSPAPHAAYLKLPGRTVLSSSPELFLKIDGRRAITRPIKGTRPRDADPIADARNARELVASPKERAELIMITDLERNDLGQVCAFGSVGASEVLKLERFEQVHHLVSTVEGELRPEIDAVTAVRACFPGGSITGAPKIRAMEIIEELEPVPRGLFTGAIGYFGFDGGCQFNIAIRTAVIEHGEAHFQVGAGIVADSNPEAEWEETLHKAAGIRSAASQIGSD